MQVIVNNTKRTHWDTVGVCAYKAKSDKQTHFYFKLSASRMVIIVRKSACGALQCYL